MKPGLLLLLPFFIYAQHTTHEIQEAELKAAIHALSATPQNRTFTIDDNIDVLHYTINITANPNNAYFSGTTDIKFKALQNTSTITLDASNVLIINDVTYNGASLLNNTTHAGNQLIIDLPLTLQVDEVKHIQVSYDSYTNTAYTQSFHYTGPVVSTLSEPFYAKEWYVCKDNLSDKADEGIDVLITHPSNQKAASNGVLMNVQDNGNGTSTTHWKHSYPIVSYLAAIAVSNYVEYNNSVTIDGSTIPIINYIYPESDIPENHTLLDKVPSYIQFMHDTFGEYPYKLEKYGHAQWEWDGGMEHATMSFVDSYDRNLVVHELAHQWFGDKITCGSWQDIWLNEGFATYCSGLIVEFEDPPLEWDIWKGGNLNSIMTQTTGSVYINDPFQATNPARIFDYRITYQKGAMVLHMLRFLIGDDSFFTAVRNYLNDPVLEYGFALTPQFKAHVEAVTGTDLTEFFNDWIYGEGFPTFNLDLNLTAPGTYVLTATQESNNPEIPLFETPYEITFLGADGESFTKRFDCDAVEETYVITDIPFQVTDYRFNFHRDVIARVGTKTLRVQDVEYQPFEVEISPNPAKDFVHIKSWKTIKNIVVFDASGKIIYNEPIDDTEYSINTSNWQKGVYLIRIESDLGILSEKLIVE